jgi:hypothetical protein
MEMPMHKLDRSRVCSRRRVISGSDARIIVVAKQPAHVQPWGKQRDDADREGISGKDCPTRPSDRAIGKPSVSSVCAVHAQFLAALAGHPPRPIPIDADGFDLEDRADHLSKVFSALSVYLAVLLDDTAQNVPGGLDLRDAEGVLADLASDLTGTIQRAADSMAGWLA